MAIAINQDNFDQEIKKSSKPVVLDVYATWCGPCQQMAPIVEELEAEFGDVYKFGKLNVEESRNIAMQYGVTLLPTFLFINNNEIKGKETGYMSKDELREKITNAFKS